MPKTASANPPDGATQLVKVIANGAMELARERHHRYALPETLLHFALGITQFQSYYRSVFEQRHHVLLKSIREQLLKYLDDNAEAGDGVELRVPTSFNQLCQRIETFLHRHPLATAPIACLMAFFSQPDSLGANLLQSVGITPPELVRDARAIQETIAVSTPKNEEENPLRPDTGDAATPRKSALQRYAVELVAMARNGKIDPLVGRDAEVDRLVAILHKKRSNNALIVGNEGTGKTALVEGLALRIAKGKVPATIRKSRIYALEVGAMVAGSSLRGSFEQRLEDVVREIAAQPGSFLFIDELHTVIGAGSGGREGSMDASNILKPYLARGEVRCIGATTYDEYQKRILSDRAFARRFKKLDLAEPSPEETLRILEGLRPAYEKFHSVQFPPELLRKVVDLAQRFIHDRFFPDKAIDILDECGALYHGGLKTGPAVTEKDIEEVVCRIANLPALTIENDDRENLRTLEDDLKKVIFGQDEAIGELCRRVKIAKAGFQDARKPLLSAFLCGPSGCGKTELARQLAARLGIAFVKLDMSEYNEEYASSRLIGSAPGYVGYDRPGALTEPVIQTPHCVILLDEIEKAHLAVFNILLQVLDEGRLHDNKGREASFRNAIILLTSNAGSRDASDASQLLGFNRSDDDNSRNRSAIVQRALKKTFPPEFRNRIQCTVMMNELSRKNLEEIVGKNLRLLNLTLAEKHVEIRLTPAAIAAIAAEAEAEHLGGRPVERLVEAHVKEPLVDEILFGRLRGGGLAVIDHAEDAGFTHTITPPTP